MKMATRNIGRQPKGHYYDEQQVQLIKDHNLACLSLFASQAALASLRAQKQSNREQLLGNCLEFYANLIETRMDQQLGEVGVALYQWFAIISSLLNGLESSGANKIAALLAVEEPRTLANLDELVRASVAHEADYPVEQQYIEQAYATGAGVCVHLKQPPFSGLIRNVLAPLIETYLGQQQAADSGQFVALDSLGEPQGAKEPGQYSFLVTLYLLNDLCNKFAASGETHFKPPQASDAANDRELEQKRIDYVRTGVAKLVSSEPACDEPAWLAYVRDLYLVLGQLSPNSQPQLVGSGLETASNLFAERCLSQDRDIIDEQHQMGVQFDLADALLTNSIVKQVELAIQSSNDLLANNDRSLMDLLNFRDPIEPVNKLEMVFFRLEQQRLDTFWKMQTYMSGDGLCEPYKRLNVYEHHDTNSRLMKVFEFMNQLLSIPGFRLRLSNKLTGHFYMWKICESLALAKLNLPDEFEH